MSDRAEYSEDVILPPDGYRLWWVDAHTRWGEEIHYEVMVSTNGTADIIDWPFMRKVRARERIEAHKAKAAPKKRGHRNSAAC